MATISLTAAMNAAAQFLEVLDSGDSLSSQQITDGFTIANDLLLSWFTEQNLAMVLLISEQSKALQVAVDELTRAAAPLVASYTLGGGAYVAATFTVPTWTPGAAPQFADNTTPITLPAGYNRAFRLALAVEIAPQYNVAPSMALLKNLEEARAAASPIPGKRPIPGMSAQSEVAPA